VSTPFLAAFAERVIGRLLAENLVQIASGDSPVAGAGAADRAATDRTILFVANWLGSRAPGSSLLSSLEAALLACPEVVEVFVDLDGLKKLVDDLG
jgi:hypothetical protein